MAGLQLVQNLVLKAVFGYLPLILGTLTNASHAALAAVLSITSEPETLSESVVLSMDMFNNSAGGSV